MKKFITFGEVPVEDPPPKTMSPYLRLDQYDRAQKAAKEETLKKDKEAVDKTLLMDKVTVTESVTIAESVTDTEKVTHTKKVTPRPITKSVTVTESVTDGEPVNLSANWMKFDNDIFLVMPELSGVELKVYLFMISRSYGLFTPQNLCTLGYQEICQALGIKATPPVSRAIKSLIQKGFIKRQFKGESESSLSIYRVLLPREASWFDTIKREQSLLSKR